MFEEYSSIPTAEDESIQIYSPVEDRVVGFPLVPVIDNELKLPLVPVILFVVNVVLFNVNDCVALPLT